MNDLTDYLLLVNPCLKQNRGLWLIDIKQPHQICSCGLHKTCKLFLMKLITGLMHIGQTGTMNIPGTSTVCIAMMMLGPTLQARHPSIPKKKSSLLLYMLFWLLLIH